MEFISNYKLLQGAFNKCKINKNLEVEKLIKAKYQDNLELLQFLKKYFELHFTSKEYDPVLRRKGNELISIFDSPKLNETTWMMSKKKLNPKIINEKGETSNDPFRNIINKIKENHVIERGENDNPNDLIKDKVIIDLNTNKLTRERDFYLSKLHDIEYLIENLQPDKISTEELCKSLNEILVSKYDTLVSFDKEGKVKIDHSKNVCE